MDSLTQIVLGAAVGEFVAGKKVGGKAALWGAIGGTIPDLDVFVSMLFDPIHSKLVHRGFSHSILFSIIGSFVFGTLVHLITKQRYEWKMWAWLMFWALLTHPLLDIFTNYGTQLFWPFDLRIAINSVFVIDPLYTLPFMLFLIIALCLKRTNKWRRRVNNFGLFYSCVYLVWGLFVKFNLQDDAANYFASRKIYPTEIKVGPMPITSFYWSYIACDQQYFYISYRSIFSNLPEKNIDSIPRQQFLMENLIWPKGEHPRLIKHFTENFYAVSLKSNNLVISDMRFGTEKQLTGGTSNKPIFSFGMKLDGATVASLDKRNKFSGYENLNFQYYWNKVFAKYE